MRAAQSLAKAVAFSATVVTSATAAIAVTVEFCRDVDDLRPRYEWTDTLVTLAPCCCGHCSVVNTLCFADDALGCGRLRLLVVHVWSMRIGDAFCSSFCTNVFQEV